MAFVFSSHEQQNLTLPANTTPHTLSKLKGLVPLSQVRPLLRFSHQTFFTAIRIAKLEPETLWTRYGIRKIFSCWYIKPSPFLKFYKTILSGGTDRLGTVNVNQLLAKRGVYDLSDVC